MQELNLEQEAYLYPPKEPDWDEEDEEYFENMYELYLALLKYCR